MKFVLPAFAAIALLVQPAFATEHNHDHDHDNVAQIAPEDAALPDGAMCDHENTLQSGVDRGAAPAGVMPGRMMGGGGMGERIMGGNMDPMKCDHAKGEPAASTDKNASSSGSAATGPVQKFWACPMHPDEVKDRPGICRHCGMDLVDKAEMDAPPADASAAPGVMKCDPKSGRMNGCCW
ncbi:MAG: hypothetical protein FD134_2547 [Gallionellaceae bacterium]|nr:MAG: hypothetical protein FD134_2547 [Gallionellaceae bacterium]